MDFELNDEQQQLKSTVERYLASAGDFAARTRALRSESGWREAVWHGLAELGVLSIGLPEAHGGFGGGLEMMAAMEELGRALAPEPVAETLFQAAPLLARGEAWQVDEAGYTDAQGAIPLPRYGLPGLHQRDNAGIAIAALRGWNPPWLTDAAIAEGVAGATWPARLQRLHGRLAPPAPWELWLDGGHNEGAGLALAETLRGWQDRPLHLVVGMKKGKTAEGFLRPLLPLAATVTAVREPGQHLAMEVAEIIAASGGAARPGPDLAGALAALRGEAPGRILVCGSLYLAGEVLKADGTWPE